MMDEVAVREEEIRISGSKAVLARAASATRTYLACGSLFCSGMARPKGFEPLASAFGAI